MLLCCLRRNVEASYHKHFVVVSRHQQTPPLEKLPATSVINSPWSVAAECIALGAPTVHSPRWSQILTQNRDFAYPTCIRRPVGILPWRLVRKN